MTDLPVLANRAMVRAILARTKTNTRRPIKGINGAPSDALDLRDFPSNPLDKIECVNGILRIEMQSAVDDTWDMEIKSPFGVLGDRLWVRERQRVIERRAGKHGLMEIRVCYEADTYPSGPVTESDWLPWPGRLKGRPVVGKCLSMGGYRESSRIMLAVKRVWDERLQDISEADLWAEAVNIIGVGKRTRSQLACGFARGWDPIYANRGFGWTENPRVWACQFELIETEKAEDE